MPPAPKPVAERLRARSVVNPETGCIEWTGHRTIGYGRIAVGGVTRYTHRVSYELYVGPIPDGFEVHHLCTNRPCMNPAHLRAITPQENVLATDSPPATLARRTHCPAGHAFAEHGEPRPGGGRRCRPCWRAYRNAWDRANRAQLATSP